ncbi:MAG: ribosome hibernation-promoting factor, HPF/YfiA family [Terriglobales bacterium]
MNVEYTGRHYEITPAVRTEIETGLLKIRKILRDKFETKVVLTLEKRRNKAEITITPRNGPLIALAQGPDMGAAINQALEHLEKQAVKYKTRWRTQKRHNHKNPSAKSANSTAWNGKASAEASQSAASLPKNKSVPLLVHKFPAVAKSTEVHLVHSDDSVALRPMTIEEAIKEAHFRDRDVFVFRDPKGKVMVLHRTREGKMELIEAP